MNQENFDKLIKENTIAPGPASKEQLEQFKTFSKKRALTQRLYTGAAACCVAILLTGVYSLNFAGQSKMLDESDMAFISDVLALEDENSANDEDIYLYSELITL